MYIDNSGQWVLGVGAAFDSDSQNRFGLPHGDAQVTLMIGHHQGAVLLPALRHLAAGQPLHAVMPSRRAARGPTAGGPAARTTLLQQLRLLHVEAPRELVREFLKRAKLALEPVNMGESGGRSSRTALTEIATATTGNERSSRSLNLDYISRLFHLRFTLVTVSKINGK